MADQFSKCRKSSRTALKVAQMLSNGFLGAYGIVCDDFGGIYSGSKAAHFRAKSHGFEDGRFW